MTNLSSISWIFVCQAGSLEQESCVLAASMRSVLGDDVKLIAAIPQGEHAIGQPSSDTIDFLVSLNVNCRPFANALIQNSIEYREFFLRRTPEAERKTERVDTKLVGAKADSPLRHSWLLMNKAYALQVDCDAPIAVFLDSDQICHREFDISNVAVPFVARRAFYPGAKATDGIWQRAYDLCETAMPTQRIVARSRDPEDPAIVCPPYFNSGFIAVHRPWAGELIENYIGCFQTISKQELLGHHRYFEEQMALAIAVMKTGVPYEVDNHRVDMSFFHYYSIARLASFDKHRRRVIDLAHQYPKLKELLMADKQWRNLLDDRFAVQAR